MQPQPQERLVLAVLVETVATEALRVGEVLALTETASLEEPEVPEVVRMLEGFLDTTTQLLLQIPLVKVFRQERALPAAPAPPVDLPGLEAVVDRMEAQGQRALRLFNI
jgi:hypothetical protein